MANTNDCIFCKIIAGKIPCAKIYENDSLIAFLDIAPLNPGHTLIVPKKHFERISETPESILFEIMKAVKKIAPAILRAVSADAFNLGLNDGKIAGQLVPHVHMHIMPRLESDGFKHWQGKKYADGEAEKVAGRIKSLLK